MPPLPPSSTSSTSSDYPYASPPTPPDYASISIPITRKSTMTTLANSLGAYEDGRKNSYSLERFLQEPVSPTATTSRYGRMGGGMSPNGSNMSGAVMGGAYQGLGANARRPRLLLMGQRR